MNKQLEAVLQAVQSELGVSRAQILAPSRSSKDVAWARQVAMWLHHHVTEDTFTEIGREFKRDRTTVRHAVNKVVMTADYAWMHKMVENVRSAAAI